MLPFGSNKGNNLRVGLQDRFLDPTIILALFQLMEMLICISNVFEFR